MGATLGAGGTAAMATLPTASLAVPATLGTAAPLSVGGVAAPAALTTGGMTAPGMAGLFSGGASAPGMSVAAGGGADASAGGIFASLMEKLSAAGDSQTGKMVKGAMESKGNAPAPAAATGIPRQARAAKGSPDDQIAAILARMFGQAGA